MVRRLSSGAGVKLGGAGVNLEAVVLFVSGSVWAGGTIASDRDSLRNRAEEDERSEGCCARAAPTLTTKKGRVGPSSACCKAGEIPSPERGVKGRMWRRRKPSASRSPWLGSSDEGWSHPGQVSRPQCSPPPLGDSHPFPRPGRLPAARARGGPRPRRNGREAGGATPPDRVGRGGRFARAPSEPAAKTPIWWAPIDVGCGAGHGDRTAGPRHRGEQLVGPPQQAAV